ncbi:hypothetical protein AB1Y20_014524 [Prymnesium parvum]|uniref:Uncharacterized protein n=1 Tax=Prymnesium parvum TaxID=97485 RepID=A0AB34IAY6_PRYPA
MPREAEAAESTSAPAREEAEAVEAVEEHDLRETLAHFRRPHPRQRWIERDGAYINTADIEPRGTPPYLLIMDLVFAALFTRMASIITGGTLDQAGYFFLFCMPYIALWGRICYLLNACDAEDVVFELFSVTVNMLMLLTTFRIQECTVARDGCAMFASAYGAMRLLVILFEMYLAWFIKEITPLLYRELFAFCFIGPYLAWLSMISHEVWVGPLVFGCFIFDTVLFIGAGLLPRAAPQPTGNWMRDAAAHCVHKLSWTPTTLDSTRVPYTARFERLLIIALGSMVTNSVSEVASLPSMTMELVLAYCIGVPWNTLLLKCFYFDLSPHSRSNPHLHAMRISSLRGGLWSLSHGPMIASVLWMSASLSLHLDQRTIAMCDSTCATYGVSIISYLFFVTAIQLLHKGHGHGHRRLGKHLRMSIRVGLMLCLACLLIPACLGMINKLFYVWLQCVLLTVEASIELWGRGFRSASSLPTHCEHSSQHSLSTSNIRVLESSALQLGMRLTRVLQ